MRKLLAEGKTDLLTGFKSARTGRLFKAYLVLDKAKGKVGFEFEAKAPKAGKTVKDAAEGEAGEAKAEKAPAKKTTAKTASKTTVKKASALKTATKAATKAVTKATAKTPRAKKAEASDEMPPDDNPPLSAYDDEPPF